MERVWITRSPRRILHAIYESVKQLLNLSWVDYKAAVEISRFPGERDGFGSVWHRTPDGRGTEPRATPLWAEPDTEQC